MVRQCVKEMRRLEGIKAVSRVKMDRKERAKQFMPFAALKGFEALLAEKEKIVVEKIILSEESKAELDYSMKEIHKNDMVTVTYYFDEEYIKCTGMVSKIDADSRYIKIVNTKISFDDIYDVKKESNYDF